MPSRTVLNTSTRLFAALPPENTTIPLALKKVLVVGEAGIRLSRLGGVRKLSDMMGYMRRVKPRRGVDHEGHEGGISGHFGLDRVS